MGDCIANDYHTKNSSTFKHTPLVTLMLIGAERNLVLVLVKTEVRSTHLGELGRDIWGWSPNGRDCIGSTSLLLSLL